LDFILHRFCPAWFVPYFFHSRDEIRIAKPTLLKSELNMHCGLMRSSVHEKRVMVRYLPRELFH
jgi:hypothetical protein